MAAASNSLIQGRISAIAIKEREFGPLRSLTEATAVIGQGIDGDIPASIQRGVTLLSLHDWNAVQKDLGVQAHWHTRRANLLIDGAGGIGHWIGRMIQVGEAVIAVRGETRPCARMDAQVAGLTRALASACRGGVHGEVIRGGRMRLGDAVTEATGVEISSP